MRSLRTGQWSATAAGVVRHIARDSRYTEALRPALQFDNTRGPLKNHQRNTLHLALDNAIALATARRHGNSDIAHKLDAVKRHLLGSIRADRLQQITAADTDGPVANELQQSVAALTAAALASINMFTIEERAVIADQVATVLHAIDSTGSPGAHAWLSAMLNFRIPGHPHLRDDYIDTWNAFK